jgi:hypothetical protein
MEPHVIAAGTGNTGWVIGWVIGIVVVLAVVALVVPILLLARSIGNEAPKINDALAKAVHNTAPLAALRTTIEHATIIIGGLQRGRARLGG